jgi:multicomponent Na+:H+ antiporter subunit C
MYVILSLLVGVLFACGVFLLLRRSIIKIVFGLVLMGHGANLLLFVAGGLQRGVPALVEPGAGAPPPGHADPVPQALVLTAIVIGLAVVSFAAVLVKRAYRVAGSDDSEQLRQEVA